MSKYNVLIVEDCPLLVEYYKLLLNKIYFKEKKLFFKINETTSTVILQEKTFLENIIPNSFDLIILGTMIPYLEVAKPVLIEDVGCVLKQKFCNAKLMVIASLNSNFRLYNILQIVQPQSLLIKKEITGSIFTESVLCILRMENYYCKKVIALMAREIGKNNVLDNIDRKILFHLANGTSTKKLPEYVHMSLSGIEKRKRKIAVAFKLTNASTSLLIKTARIHGYV